MEQTPIPDLVSDYTKVFTYLTKFFKNNKMDGFNCWPYLLDKDTKEPRNSRGVEGSEEG